MDEVHYICLCQRQFLSLKELNLHQLTCADCVCPFDNNETCKITSYSIPREFSEGTPEVIIEIVRKDGEEFQNQNVQKREQAETKLLGRKLPNRTKVPFLSRAVPLSTDHSFERCTCGAVFVTRVGKRQHQARFCKNGNKNKVKSGNVVKEVRVVSVSKRTENEIVSNEYCAVEENENEDEDSVIENQGCEVVEDNALHNLERI